MKPDIATIKAFWVKYEHKIVLILGIILIAAVSFEGGYLRGKTVQNKAVVIENPAQNVQNEPVAAVKTDLVSDTTPGNNAVPEADLAEQKKSCAFVGSKNSNKVHVPTCQWAKRIKPANLVCFASLEVATGQGRTADKCIK
jgi:hypothetical protein